jgi:hypothetical protein
MMLPWFYTLQQGRTLAVTEPPSKNLDLIKRITGGFG